MLRVVLLAVLTAALIGRAAVGFGAPAVVAPAITASPSNPSNSHSASFTYTNTQAITRFECSLDGAAFKICGTTRPSSTGFTSVPEGRHIFRVRAVSGAATGPAASYSWVIDTTAPRIASINRLGASPTNAPTVRWMVAFSETVTGVLSDGGSFLLVATGLSGQTIVAPVTGSGAVYTVTASTGTANGTLQLRLSAPRAIADPAGNGLTGVPFNGQAYTIDKTPPPEPGITSGPASVWPSTRATFGFTDHEAGVAFICSLDGVAPATCRSPQAYTSLSQGSHAWSVQARDAAGNLSTAASRTFLVDALPPNAPTLTLTPTNPRSSPDAAFAWLDTDPSPGSGVVADSCRLDAAAFASCSSPKTYTSLLFGSHTFSVRAVDAAGNRSPAATFTWMITGLPFAIAGSASSLLYPGAPFTPISLAITNPNSVAIVVTSIRVTIGNDPSGCASASNLEVQQSAAAPTNGLTVPAHGSDWAVPPPFQPRIRLKETGSSQDACEGQTFTFSYTGSAHS